MELGVHGRDVGESDVVAGGHARQHGRHVVQQELDGAHAAPPDAADAADAARGGQHRRAAEVADGRGAGALRVHSCLALSPPLHLYIKGCSKPRRVGSVCKAGHSPIFFMSARKCLHRQQEGGTNMGGTRHVYTASRRHVQVGQHVKELPFGDGIFRFCD